MKRILVTLAVSLLVLAGLSCGITVRATAPQPAPATKEAVIRQYVEGRKVVIFGDEQFIANARDDVEAVGMVVLTATDLSGAIALAGDASPVEIHCVDASGNDLVIQADKAESVLFQGKQVLKGCPKGVIFLGFFTEENPDAVVYTATEEK